MFSCSAQLHLYYHLLLECVYDYVRTLNHKNYKMIKQINSILDPNHLSRGDLYWGA